MKKIYQIAGHKLCFTTPLCEAMELLVGFRPFISDAKEEYDFVFEEGNKEDIPTFDKVEYTLEYEDVKGTFGISKQTYLLCLCPEGKEELWLWTDIQSNTVFLYGNYELYLLRFALWVGFGLMTCRKDTLAIHSSCIVYRDKAVLFLGESGTGKSTHTRLWRENIPGAVLLNDDSPMIRVEDGKVWAYGSPWSGKTPCYKNERYELKGCVRLSQAPYNRIQKLTVLQSVGALHPSCAPEFAYDDYLYDGVSRTLNGILSAVPCFHLACLPDEAAARLSCNTLFQ
jgi:hypothetical protein